MRKLGRVTILTLLIIILSTLLFVACDKDGAKEKQVPVYKGMTISRSFAKATATAALNDAYNTDSQGGQGRASAVRPSIIAAV